jgi:DNA-binding MarR family transcriptional regulator
MVEQKRRSEDVDLGILVGLAYQAFTDKLWEALGRQGFDDLGGAYGYVFRALADEELSQRELATRLAITDQGMAKILGEMIDRGYVERRTDSEDARVKRLRLARRGRDALAAARQFHASFERKLARDVGPAAVRTLRRALQAMTGLDGADVGQARLRPM